MFYPEDFKTKVKKVYPNWKKLHQKLDNGDPSVGSDLLIQNRPMFSFSTSLEELQEKEKRKNEIAELCLMWRKLFYEQKN